MLRFLGNRLVLAVATLLALSIVTFTLGRMAPGGPVEVLMAQHADANAIAQLKRDFGLDQPLPVQYVRWISGFVRGDFGISYRDRQPVATTLIQRYPVTVRLALMAAAFAASMGLMLGVLAALKPGSWLDRTATTIALAGASIPAFVMLPLLVLYFSLRLKWSPVTYEGEWWHLTLPAIALGTRPAALIARITRAAFLDALSQDYVRTARAKGVAWGRTVVRHAGKNAVLPVLTVFGTSVGYMLGGSFVVETIFGIPGIGGLSISSINDRDYPILQAVTVLASTVFIGVNLLVDILYGFLDPRLRIAARAD